MPNRRDYNKGSVEWRLAYERGRREQRIALGYDNKVIAADLQGIKTPALQAEQVCTGCKIGEFSVIGAGPFENGLCRYCSALNAYKPIKAALPKCVQCKTPWDIGVHPRCPGCGARSPRPARRSPDNPAPAPLAPAGINPASLIFILTMILLFGTLIGTLIGGM